MFYVFEEINWRWFRHNRPTAPLSHIMSTVSDGVSPSPKWGGGRAGWFPSACLLLWSTIHRAHRLKKTCLYHSSIQPRLSSAVILSSNCQGLKYFATRNCPVRQLLRPSNRQFSTCEHHAKPYVPAFYRYCVRSYCFCPALSWSFIATSLHLHWQLSSSATLYLRCRLLTTANVYYPSCTRVFSVLKFLHYCQEEDFEVLSMVSQYCRRQLPQGARYRDCEEKLNEPR